MVHIIRKNTHKSDNRKFRLFLFKKKISHNVFFNNNCEYNLDGIDQFDINKLFGMSFGFHHKNSARFGWRWSEENQSMEILAYVYRNGERVKEWDENIKICNLKPFESAEMSIDVKDDNFVFTVKKLNPYSTYTTKIKHGNLKLWGYYLNPYFGGNRESPHDMTIMLS
jgi:hypothetical protein